MGEYKAVLGHVGDVAPGSLFESRVAVKAAKLTKETVAGISWGVDDERRKVADAIVLNDGYVDDVDRWNEIIYTGAGGQRGNSKRQVEDQDWENRGNASLRMSRIQRTPVRVIRGYKGVEEYSPLTGYRYDGLYEVLEDWDEAGKEGFRICRFRLRRLDDRAQELTSVEEQLRDLLHQPVTGVEAGGDELDVSTRRRTSTINRIIRDTAVSRRVKRLHDYTCQVCGIAVSVGRNGESYAEGAHIHALGGPEGGPDVDGNVLCLCPNCHVRLDRGALYITDNLHVVDRYASDSSRREVPLRTVEQHRIQAQFVRAHRRFWGISMA
ncbi:YDG/SRA domain-containing protein [Streptomyces sp. NE06-03E]|uniref:YDG/SRA domain-containing protein n=1 Tax=unclassified Streptomyces TaxID=2593676 RepID=UPI0029BF9FC4|nr:MULTISPECIES: YDG/SRA domain-containing protein [unclassified Streptomyces]MDX3058150.1 YDG/SRA domain-containing protein [Streptomyces sp. NE06-03E]